MQNLHCIFKQYLYLLYNSVSCDAVCFFFISVIWFYLFASPPPPCCFSLGFFTALQKVKPQAAFLYKQIQLVKIVDRLRCSDSTEMPGWKSFRLVSSYSKIHEQEWRRAAHFTWGPVGGDHHIIRSFCFIITLGKGGPDKPGYNPLLARTGM